MSARNICLTAALALLLAASSSFAQRARPADREWKVFGGTAENTHYSPLRQINRDNVARLKVAWSYDTGDAFPGSELQCNPIITGGVLYATTPKMRVIAVDSATGEVRWSFDPNEEKRAPGKMRNRGLTYWTDGRDRRILVVFRHWLYALDAATGRPVAAFGQAGRVDLREGLGRPPQEMTVSATTPGVLYRD